MLEYHAEERADVERVHLDEVARAGGPVVFGLADGVGAFGAGVAASDAWARRLPEESAPLRVGEDASGLETETVSPRLRNLTAVLSLP